MDTRNYLRKIIIITLVVVLIICSVAGCVGAQTDRLGGDGKLHILCTTFPLYDWAREVTDGCGDICEVSLLMEQGTDLHNYQPTAADIIRISDADIVIYVGGESDRWMADVLEAMPEERKRLQQRLNLMEILGTDVREEEEFDYNTEGHYEKESSERPIENAAEISTGGVLAEAGRSLDNGASSGQEEDVEYDEHIWLSVKNAAECVRAIEKNVTGMLTDTDAIQRLSENADRYLDQLLQLDQEYAELAETAPYHMLVFADRFPFLYLMKDYGWEYYAAFPGCSTETDASFETIIFLAGKVEEYDLPAVLVMENGNLRIAETVLENAGAVSDGAGTIPGNAGAVSDGAGTIPENMETVQRRILTVDSMQSVTGEEISQGITYLSVMRGNLSVFREALGCGTD